MKTAQSVDAYIASFPLRVQVVLHTLRQTIRAAAPSSEEKISYGIPTYKMGRNLVHFGAYDTHIGFYPTSSGIRHFAMELAKFETGKGTVRFPVDKPLPLGLIKRITTFRVKEEVARSRAKR